MLKPTYDRQLLVSLMKEAFVMLINSNRTEAAEHILRMAHETQTAKDLPAAYKTWYECERVLYDELFANTNTK